MPVSSLSRDHDKEWDMFFAGVSKAFTPNELVTPRVAGIIIVGWLMVALAYWTAVHPVILPSPLDVIAAFPRLWNEEGLGQELITSISVNIEALVLSAAVSLPLTYLSRIPVVRPLADGISKLRFLSPSIFFVVLLFVAGSVHEVKVLMLAIGETFFLVTTMIGVIRELPEAHFDDARTLRMSEWQATWYVAIRGTVPQVFDAIRDNAAMGWSMLMFVEGFVRSEGGVGVMLLNQEKHADFAEVYAIAIAVVLVGITQDYIISVLRRICCPYAGMTTR